MPDWELRFWEKVAIARPNKCWIWQAQIADGYGRFYRAGHPIGAHRAAYELMVGPVPEDLVLDHLCRNRACVNPAHLEPVTHAENMRRGARANQTHCKHGHPFTTANTEWYRGKRACRTCKRLWRQKHKAAILAYQRRWKQARYVPKRPLTHCRNGHEFTPENTYWSRGQRACRTCKLAYLRAKRSA